MKAITILYVENQEKSRDFYINLLRKQPVMDVAGMTEFQISPEFILGLMPNTGAARILQDKTPHPDTGLGIPRCELYFYVDAIDLEYTNALASGALLISPVMERNWGDSACYFADPDGHIIAFAQKEII